MPGHKEQTLCWGCAKACGGCSWSNHWDHLPITGWIAVPCKLKVNRGEYVESFHVTECPEFEPDPPRFIRRTK